VPSRVENHLAIGITRLRILQFDPVAEGSELADHSRRVENHLARLLRSRVNNQVLAVKPGIAFLMQRAVVAAFRASVDGSSGALSCPPLRPLEILGLWTPTLNIACGPMR
jgi:hypothetical protein